MARLNRLNSLTVQKANKPGFLADGGGLYLQISPAGTKSWVFRFALKKRKRMAGLGPLDRVSLAEARDLAASCRKQLQRGIDPILARKEDQIVAQLQSARAMTFDQAAAAYIDAHRAAWKNAKHASQWENTIETHASPIIGKLPICEIDTALVMKVVEPLWYTKTETASRLRNRVELVLSWATVRGFRKGDNPARWTGHLDQLLPKRTDVQKRKHFAALPFKEIGNFIEKLRALSGIAPLGLEFCILCATRTGETMGAKFIEIEDGVWTIPAERMKAGRPHRIPLSGRALEIVNIMRTKTEGEFIFPGRTSGSTLCNNAFLAILKNLMSLSITAHGFRSAFRDWAAERTNYPREVVEMALAHTIKDATESAYRRGDLLLKRQSLMNQWAKFCDSPIQKTTEILEMKSRFA